MQNTDRLCMGCMTDNGGEQVCPICGYDKETPLNPSMLAPKTWLEDRYLIGKTMDSNGEGVSYIGWDNKNDTIVKIREYFPTDLCEREENGRVRMTDSSETIFKDNKARFVQLAKTLESLKDVPALMNVFDVFEANGTAYYVVQTVSGITLREFLLRNGGVLKWEQARPLFMPLFTAMAAIHNAGILHRGISPETLMVGRDGVIRITGFCIPDARTARSDMTAQLFPGFAAIEQYGFDGQQGRWTDVYGFAATLFRALIGNPPPEATERVTDDNMSIPGKIAQELPSYVLTALANALQILPEDRTESLEEFKEELSQIDEDAYDEDEDEDLYEDDYYQKGGNKRYGVLAAVATILLVLIVLVVLAATVFKDTFFPTGDGGEITPPEVTSAEPLPLETTEKKYDVPNGIGKSLAEMLSEQDYIGIFEFEIVSADYSEDVERGFIMEQTPAAGESRPKGEKIQFKVSLGKRIVTMPSLMGKTADEAKAELFALGIFANAVEVADIFDPKAEPEKVIETDPKAGSSLSPGAFIRIYVNTYKPASSSEITSATPTTTEKPESDEPSTSTSRPPSTSNRTSTPTSDDPTSNNTSDESSSDEPSSSSDDE